MFCDVGGCRFDTSGTLTWSSRWGGMNDERVNAVTVDSTGGIYIAGQFSSPTMKHYLGGSNAGTAVATNANSAGGIYDGFVARLTYSTALTIDWTQSFGGMMDDFATAVTTDGIGKWLPDPFAVHLCVRISASVR